MSTIVLYVVGSCIFFISLLSLIISLLYTCGKQEDTVFDTKNVYDRCKNGTVTVISGNVVGSGFVFSVPERDYSTKLYISTCAHVVVDEQKPLYVVIGGANGDETQNIRVRCDIVGVDKQADVAVLLTRNKTQIGGYNFTKQQTRLTWGNSTSTKIGSTCWIIGNPMHLDHASVAKGVVRDNKWFSQLGDLGVESVLTSAPATYGNSGSPILDDMGKVIGMTNWILRSNSSFAGGVSQFMLQAITRKIVITNQNYIDKSYLGVQAWRLLQGAVLAELEIQFHSLKNYNRISGIQVLQLDTNNTSNLLQNDIILSLTHKKEKICLGIFDNEFSPTRMTWFVPPNDTVQAEVLRVTSRQLIFLSIDIETKMYPEHLETAAF